jgi:hypothetical protein
MKTEKQIQNFVDILKHIFNIHYLKFLTSLISVFLALHNEKWQKCIYLLRRVCLYVRLEEFNWR